MKEILELTTEVHPFILFVEDRDKARDYGTLFLKELGCSVVAVKNADEAIKMFMLSPNLDLVFTDIDLLGVEGKDDKSGVDLARFIKQLNCDLPIIGYSSKFDDNGLDINEKLLFDGWFGKGKMVVQELFEMYTNLKKKANEHKIKRFDEISDIFNGLIKRNVIENESFGKAIEIAFKFGETPFNQIDEAMNGTGYKLICVNSESYTRLTKSILVWIRVDDNLCETEVYGHSDLFCFGDSQNEAVHNLLILMEGFYEDMRLDSENNYSGPALKIRRFLFNIFN